MISKVFFIAFTLVLIYNVKVTKIIVTFMPLKFLNNYLYNNFF